MESADNYFVARLEQDPNDVTALFGRANLKSWLAEFSDAGETEERHDSQLLLDLAIEDYNRLVKLDSSAEIYLRRGHALALKGNFRAAIEDFDTALEIAPDKTLAIRRRPMRGCKWMTWITRWPTATH